MLNMQDVDNAISWAVQSVLCLRENLPCAQRLYSAVALQNELYFKELFYNANFGPLPTHEAITFYNCLNGRHILKCM